MEEEITIEETTKDGSTWTVVRKGCQTLILKDGAFYGVRETGSGIYPRSLIKSEQLRISVEYFLKHWLETPPEKDSADGADNSNNLE